MDNSTTSSAQQLFESFDDSMKKTLTNAFDAADDDGDGQLSIEEFSTYLQGLSLLFPKLNINDKTIALLAAKTDINNDGLISFEEFLPGVIDVLKNVNKIQEKHKLLATYQAKLYLIHGMDQKTLENSILSMCKEIDSNNNGTISLKEFREGLVDILDFKKSNLILNSLYSSEFGVDSKSKVISYQKIIPFIYEKLVQFVRQGILSNRISVQNLTAAINEYLHDAEITAPFDMKLVVKALNDACLGDEYGLNQDDIDGLVTCSDPIITKSPDVGSISRSLASFLYSRIPGETDYSGQSLKIPYSKLASILDLTPESFAQSVKSELSSFSKIDKSCLLEAIHTVGKKYSLSFTESDFTSFQWPVSFQDELDTLLLKLFQHLVNIQLDSDAIVSGETL